ncbi:hypothetical protein [Streptomyces sp. NPDC058644]|uniref:DUF6197 family protein n=1 Tax=unclassified Streptomyces TaxID=2593676 RepID=UPI00364DDD1D
MKTKPTDLPAGDRCPVLVTGITIPSRPPTTVREVERAAARIIAANGLFQGDLVEDTFNRRLTSPHTKRPMSIVAALNCAATGDPHRTSDLSRAAVSALAHRLLVQGQGPYAEDELALVFHVDAWGDVEGRTTESACAVLEAAADACGVAA